MHELNNSTNVDRTSFSSGGSETVQKDKENSIPSQEGILQTQHGEPGTSVKEVEPNPTRSRSTSNTASILGSASSDNLSDHQIDVSPEKVALDNKATRNSISSTLSRLFSRFISCFAFPKMSFPKSMAAQKEEAIAKVLSNDTQETRKALATLLKKGSKSTE